MSKVVKTVATVAAIAGLAVVTGGAALGLGVSLGTTAFGVSAATLLTTSSALSIGASLLDRPKAPSTSAAATDRLSANIDPRTARKIAFGTTALATDLRDQEYTGSSQELLHRFLVCASHQVAGYREIWLDDKLAWSEAGGIAPEYVGYLGVECYAVGSAANAKNISARMGGTRRYTGLGWVYLRLKTTGNSKKVESPFAQSIPSRITIIGDGALVYDPRLDSTVPGGSGPQRANDQATWAWSASGGRNPALQLLWYLLGWRIQNPVTGEWKLAVGKGIPPERINFQSFITAANQCDETVLLASGGTQPRYRSDGVFSEADATGTVLDQLKAAMNAELDDVDGKIRITVLHNDLATPVVDLTTDDVIGAYKWDQTAPLGQGYFNVVRGTFVDPSSASLFQPIDYSEVRIASPDGIDRVETVDFQTVQDPAQAQRLVKQMVARMLYSGTFTATFSHRAWKAQKNDVVRLTFAPLGWVNKLFRIAEGDVQVDGQVPLILRQEHPDIYLWDRDERPAIQPVEPTRYDPYLNPVYQGIEEAGDTAVWDNITGAGKPEDNATVGATPEQVQKLIDLDAAKDQAAADIAGLIDTYGSTAAAAASADAAAQHEANSQTAAANAGTARDQSEAARAAAAQILGETGTVRDQAVGAKTAAETAAANGATYRDQSSQSATNASGSAGLAQEQAGLSAQARNDSQAGAAASLTYRDQAAASSTLADQSATASRSSEVAATTAAQALMPADFRDLRNWTGDWGTATGDWSIDGRMIAYDDADFGRIARVDNNPAFSPHIAAKGRTTLIRDHHYRITAKWMLVGEQAEGAQAVSASLFFVGIKPNSAATGDYFNPNDSFTVSPGLPGWGGPNWATHTIEVDANPLLDQGCQWTRPLLRIDSQGVYYLQSIEIRDITGEVNARGSADAAAGSAATASIARDQAGASASSAIDSATRAETASDSAGQYRSDAETFRNQASGSASNAAGSAATASEAAGLSAQARDSAGAFASASAGSAGVATAKADEAGQSANASQSSSVTAGNAASGATDIFAKSFPSFVGPIGKAAYVYMGDDSTGFTFESGPDAGWPQPYITSQNGGFGGTYNRISFKDSVPKTVGRRYRVSGWFYNHGNNAALVKIWLLNSNNNVWDANAYGRDGDATPANHVNHIALNQGGFWHVGTEFTVTADWAAQWKPIFEFQTTGGAPNGLWHMTGMHIEDITSEKASADSASAASSSYSSAAYEAGLAAQRAEAASGYSNTASIFAGNSQSSSNASAGSAATATDRAAAAAQNELLTAAYRDEAKASRDYLWPADLSPTNAGAYRLPTGAEVVGPSDGWPQGYLTQMGDGVGGTDNTMEFRKWRVRPEIGRKIRVTAWAFNHGTNNAYVYLWAISSISGAGDGSAVGHSGAAVSGTTNHIPVNGAAGFVKFVVEFTVDSSWKANWSPVLQFTTTGGASNGLWHFSGMVVEDVTDVVALNAAYQQTTNVVAGLQGQAASHEQRLSAGEGNISQALGAINDINGKTTTFWEVYAYGPNGEAYVRLVNVDGVSEFIVGSNMRVLGDVFIDGTINPEAMAFERFVKKKSGGGTGTPAAGQNLLLYAVDLGETLPNGVYSIEFAATLQTNIGRQTTTVGSRPSYVNRLPDGGIRLLIVKNGVNIVDEIYTAAEWIGANNIAFRSTSFSIVKNIDPDNDTSVGNVTILIYAVRANIDTGTVDYGDYLQRDISGEYSGVNASAKVRWSYL